jgi:predicted amidohydrolase YtcJ
VAKFGMRDHRPVFVHGTYMRPDQIDRAERYGAIPSYLTSSFVSGGAGAMFMWGGERGNKVVAANTLENRGMPFTFSHDAPVTPVPWILPLVDAGVNRTTAEGQVIGEKERVSPYVALKAVTAYAAFQIKEENTKGTLEVGKLADMVILEQNPLKVDPKTIKDIRVMETIKEGETVFSKN